jgi:hypothetical protein
VPLDQTASNLTENASSADNQQETRDLSCFYVTGFCCGEISVSIIRAKSKTRFGYKYYPDITISNIEISLLKRINFMIGNDQGIISRIKGGYNLSFRGKRKVKLVLSFFTKYPPLAGDLVLNRLSLINTAIFILESRTTRSWTPHQIRQLESLRFWLRNIKQQGKPIFIYPQKTLFESRVGHFLAGILDAEGSVGMKKSGDHYQPFIALAMKDKKIVDLFQQFCNSGKVRYRSRDGTYHFEIGSIEKVKQILNQFLIQYPFQLSKMKYRVDQVLRILNDYTPGTPIKVLE